MHNAKCLACGSGLTLRRDEAPMRLYACVRCAGGKEALECQDCHLRFNGIPGKSPCPRCLESELADRHIYPGKGWKGPI